MRKSAGLLVYRFTKNQVQFFLVHPGGPFWKNKDLGTWSIPKGEFNEELPLAAALREFEEETGQTVEGNFIELEPVLQKGGKQVYAWAVESEVDENHIVSNNFPLEWPPKSGKWQTVPEIDKAAWFDAVEARQKIIPAQISFIDQLLNVYSLT